VTELNHISAQLVSAYPKEYAGSGMFVTPMQEEISRDARPALMAILGAVLLVLLIAAANVVNLQLARAVRRETEFNVRVALGAGTRRIAQQLAAEGLVLAVLGGGIGVAIGRLMLPLLVARLPRSLPRIAEVHLDAGVLAAIGIVVAMLAIVLGLVPAAGARRRAVFSGALRGATRLGLAGHQRTRAALVVGEIALALMLLAGAGLLAKSLLHLLAVDAGFEPANLVTMSVESSGPRYPTSASALEFRRRAMDAARALPGVVDIGTTTTIPLGGELDMYGIAAEDRPIDNPALAPWAMGYRVDGRYLRTMKIRLLAGRDFDAADTRDSAESVAIVSAALARSIWAGEDPIGRRIAVPNARAKWSRVVGVVADVRHRGLDSDADRAFYIPEEDWQWANSSAFLVARVRGDAATTARAIRAAVAALDPSQPITNVRSMDAVVAASAAQRRLALTLFAAFAALAVLLAAAGVYGVLAGSVAERTREIGLRSALGASPGDLLRMVLARGFALAAAGVAIGIAGAFALTRYLESLLFATAPMDAAVMIGSVSLLSVVAILACVLPARRAVRIDPMIALRE
jgi:putative ABC transport system permease protein